MSGILDLLNSDLGKSIVSGVAGQTNQPQNKTQDVLTMALPLLTAAMKRNANSPQGAEGLMNALNSKHDGSILDNLGGFFEGGVDSNVINDGGNILGHVLGSKQQHIENTLGAKSGMDANSVSQMLKIAAPLLLGVLGKQSRQNNVSSTNDLGNLLGGLVSGNSAGQEQNFLETLLDADGDGSVIDDVAGMMLGGDKSKNDLGGMLGSLFGGK
ncbi:DUF937 domain-containing protein [Tamlana sp. 2_MG-2023]|uniref:DUF937 domain-containing protein n=1 Tax=unclassified Tamlana TaxID=2614803 RepID=UPI0026E2C08C|nr:MULTISPECIES: DUF937 domain-containing protein [unclassified Tamlana]MDO6758815.1 DUF937 domain-containing protein [Tamlana sp. 2_MG-2023]MDO6789514.1 DUF937 domain-containing protein [Tamlana sp. 1_MG-2023]